MQSSTAQDHYLFTEVNTAAPQKLQLLLIEGALNIGESDPAVLAAGPQRSGHRVAGSRPGDRVGQMLAGINYEVVSELATAHKRRSTSSIPRCLANAVSRHDDKSLGDAIRILEIDSETWRQLCDKLAVNAPHASFADAPRLALPAQSGDADLLSQSGGFSIEA